MDVQGLISDLAFILLLGAVVTVLFKWIKQPVVLGYIVAGFLASPHFEYPPSVTTEANIDFWPDRHRGAAVLARPRVQLQKAHKLSAAQPW